MWECLHCGESVEDVFAVCWRCQANRDGTPSELQDPPRDEQEEDEIAVLNEQSDEEEDFVEAADSDEEPDEEFEEFDVNCLRCQTEMNYAGTKELHEGPFRGVFGDILLLEMYVCPACLHVELFALAPNP